MCKKLIYLILFTLVLGISEVQAVGDNWDRVAYWDARYPQAWGGGGEGMRDALEAAGYTILDADQLKTWMDAHIADKALSVVVFCKDVVPDTVAESMSDTCTLRQYLDAGGKIVWYSDWPFYYQGSSDGTMVTWDSAGATSVLGFNASSGPNDSYDEVVFTDAGVAWGLTETWESQRPTSVTITENLTPLATISSGSAAAWVKHYVEGDKYRGFVRIFDRTGAPANVDDIIRLAEYTAMKAGNPYPDDGAIFLDTWVNLSWSPGAFGASHDVYFGDNFDDVNDGTPEAFQGNLPLAYFIVGFPGFPYPDGLVPGTTYYWRIDDVEADGTTKYQGNVWSFMIPPYTAYNPNPADSVKFVPPDVELNWTAGFLAKLHTVYFGDNFDDVNNAVMGMPQPATTYIPGTVELEKTYYWRVDEFDGVTTHKGDVWSFSTIPIIAITDPSLIGWWKLDEGYGTTAVDWSGHGNHGTFVGDPQWVAGYDGDALEFDGDGDFLDCGADPSLGISGAVSITAWIKVGASGLDHKVGGNQDGTNGGYKMSVQSDKIEFEIRTSDNTAILNRDIAGGTEIMPDVWYHVAGIYSQADGYIRTYVNGVLDRQLITTEALGASPGTLYIGCEPYNTSVGNFNGVMDNVRLYNKALTVEEILLAMRGDPLVAWEPHPTNGSTVYIRDATPLSWSPGDNASGHDVYFGTDKGAVADADASDTTGIYRGRQGVTIYTPPDVEWGGGPYYWRIDEYNTDATISKGNVWSFTVIDFIEIDGIEDYNDFEPDRIFDTWIDGWEVPTNGSMAGHAEPPFAETGNVHGGSQSMPVYYENNFKYSEIIMTLVYPRNWTEEGVGVLSLWFRGNPAGFVEGPAGTYTMSGAGTDIWGEADEFRYAYKQLSGDGEIVAQVLSVENTDGWAKAGVMIRESLDPGSKHAFVCITPSNGKSFQNRKQTGLSSSNSNTGGFPAPYWVKLVRQGNQFTAYHSEDGVNWVLQAANTETANPETVSMATNVYIGLALTSHNSGVTCVAEFSDVRTTGAVTPLTWTHEAIGAAMAANRP